MIEWLRMEDAPRHTTDPILVAGKDEDEFAVVQDTSYAGQKEPDWIIFGHIWEGDDDRGGLARPDFEPVAWAKLK